MCTPVTFNSVAQKSKKKKSLRVRVCVDVVRQRSVTQSFARSKPRARVTHCVVATPRWRLPPPATAPRSARTRRHTVPQFASSFERNMALSHNTVVLMTMSLWSFVGVLVCQVSVQGKLTQRVAVREGNTCIHIQVTSQLTQGTLVVNIILGQLYTWLDSLTHPSILLWDGNMLRALWGVFDSMFLFSWITKQQASFEYSWGRDVVFRKVLAHTSLFLTCIILFKKTRASVLFLIQSANFSCDTEAMARQRRRVFMKRNWPSWCVRRRVWRARERVRERERASVFWNFVAGVST